MSPTGADAGVADAALPPAVLAKGPSASTSPAPVPPPAAAAAATFTPIGATCPPPNLNPLKLRPIATHPTSWRPSSARVALNVALDGCIVPDAVGAARVDRAHLVVLDDFIGEAERSELLGFITQPGWDEQSPPPADKWQRSTRDRPDAAPTWGLRDEWLRRLASEPVTARLEVQSRLQLLYPDYLIAHMPSDQIQIQNQTQIQIQDHGQIRTEAGLHAAATSQIATQIGERQLQEQQRGQQQDSSQGPQAAASDGEPAGAGGSGGSGGGVGDSGGLGGPAAAGGPQAEETGAEAMDVEGALGGETQELEFEEYDGYDEDDSESGLGAPPGSIVDCNQFVANAAMYGDAYSWHVDADPSTLPYPSPWTLAYGQYVNREPGHPLFVSLLLYLNRNWEREWDAETLFLDTPSDCGVVVRPRAYRAVLLDQDVLHRLCPPSPSAGSRPRYSLVWKLVMLPRRPGQQPSLARKAWGRPAPFGSAAALERVMSRLAAGSVGAALTAAVGAAVAGADGGDGGCGGRERAQEPAAKGLEMAPATVAAASALEVVATAVRPAPASPTAEGAKHTKKKRKKKNKNKKGSTEEACKGLTAPGGPTARTQQTITQTTVAAASAAASAAAEVLAELEAELEAGAALLEGSIDVLVNAEDGGVGEAEEVREEVMHDCDTAEAAEEQTGRAPGSGGAGAAAAVTAAAVVAAAAAAAEEVRARASGAIPASASKLPQGGTDAATAAAAVPPPAAAAAAAAPGSEAAAAASSKNRKKRIRKKKKMAMVAGHAAGAHAADTGAGAATSCAEGPAATASQGALMIPGAKCQEEEEQEEDAEEEAGEGEVLPGGGVGGSSGGAEKVEGTVGQEPGAVAAAAATCVVPLGATAPGCGPEPMEGLPCAPTPLGATAAMKPASKSAMKKRERRKRRRQRLRSAGGRALPGEPNREYGGGANGGSRNGVEMSQEEGDEYGDGGGTRGRGAGIGVMHQGGGGSSGTAAAGAANDGGGGSASSSPSEMDEDDEDGDVAQQGEEFLLAPSAPPGVGLQAVNITKKKRAKRRTDRNKRKRKRREVAVMAATATAGIATTALAAVEGTQAMVGSPTSAPLGTKLLLAFEVAMEPDCGVAGSYRS